MTENRAEPPEGSEPDGPGFGKPWVPRPGVTFLAKGAVVRSALDLTKGRVDGIVAMDVLGKWNHAAADTLSIICHPGVAREWGQYLIEAADAADADGRLMQGHRPETS